MGWFNDHKERRHEQAAVTGHRHRCGHRSQGVRNRRSTGRHDCPGRIVRVTAGRTHYSRVSHCAGAAPAITEPRSPTSERLIHLFNFDKQAIDSLLCRDCQIVQTFCHQLYCSVIGACLCRSETLLGVFKIPLQGVSSFIGCLATPMIAVAGSGVHRPGPAAVRLGKQGKRSAAVALTGGVAE